MEQLGRVLMQHMRFLANFRHVGGFCDLRDPVLPTLRGASGDVVTMYAY